MKRSTAFVLLLFAILFTPIAHAGEKVAPPDVQVKPKTEPKKEDPPKKCRQECTTDVECGPVTYVRRCVDDKCFDYPRQHCSPKRVCTTVCD